MSEKKEFEKHMELWKKLLNSYVIPSWEDLPSFELYMDQVIAIMNDYLKSFSSPNNEQNSVITPPMINNYVKLKAMPAPQKKKYSRVHLAYLIMICSLKQALSIPTIQKIIPLLDDEAEIKKMFEAFCENQKKAFAYIAGQVSKVSKPIIEAADNNPGRMTDLSVQIAVSANIFKIITEDISEIAKNENGLTSEK